MNLLNLEDEKFKNVTVQGYKFKIRFISALDRAQIIQRRMTFQDGNPVTSLTEGEYYYFENIAINDICIEESPKEFDDNVSCIKWEDDDLINEVAQEIRNHTDDIKAKLKKNKPVAGGTE